MKVGVISKGSPDYLIDIVTDGLIRLLGRSGVSLDYNVRGGWGGQYSILLQNFSGPEPYDIHDADVLIASTRSLEAAREWIKRTGKKKIAIIDGEDFHMLNDIHLEVPVYFKREFLLFESHPHNVKPLPFAAIPEPLPKFSELRNAVFYRGHETHHFRREIVNALNEMGYPVSEDRIEKDDYNKRLMSSLIGVCVRGNGWDTYRYWETPYFGTALLSQKPEILIPENFIDGQEAIFFSTVEEFKSKLGWMMDNPNRTFEISKAGRKASKERHLSTNRAKTVLEALA